MQANELLSALVFVAILAFVMWRLKKRPGVSPPSASSGGRPQRTPQPASAVSVRADEPRQRPEASINTDKRCPHCHQEVPGERKRQFKCPSCEKPVYVRTKHGLFPRNYFTEAEARAVDGFGRVDTKPAEFEVNRQALAKSHGFEPSLPDVLWRVMNSRIPTLRDPHELKMHHFLMAMILHGEGKDPRRMKQESIRWALEDFKRGAGNSARVEVITCGEDSCEACRALARRKLTVGAALANPSSLVANCTKDENAGGFGWCRCDYGITG